MIDGGDSEAGGDTLLITAPKNLFLDAPKNMGRSPRSFFSRRRFSRLRMKRFSDSPRRQEEREKNDDGV